MYVNRKRSEVARRQQNPEQQLANRDALLQKRRQPECITVESDFED